MYMWELGGKASWLPLVAGTGSRNPFYTSYACILRMPMYGMNMIMIIRYG